MNQRNCQDCSELLPEWAQFCPFCGEKYRATRVLTPVDGPEEAAAPAPVHAPIMTEILYLGTAGAAYEAPAEPAPKAATPAPIETPRLTQVEPRVMVNPDALAMFEPGDDDDLWDDDITPIRPRGQLLVAGLAMVVTAVALVAGGIILANSSTTEAAPASVAQAAEKIEAPEMKEAPLPKLHDFEVRMDGSSHASVMYDGAEILTLDTAKGSRYDDVQTRAQSVTVRLTHIAQKQREERLENARFIARANGDVYEVVWDDGSAHPFRVKDVTRKDVSKKGEIAIQANLQADALTELFRTRIAPTPIPNS